MQGLELEIANASTLQAALVQFCGAEALGPDSDNAYACDRCEALTCAEKHLSLREAPPVLRIQLKRFAYTESGQVRKVSHLVEFPEFLDLSPYMRSAVPGGASHQQRSPGDGSESGCRYRLSSVIVHEGRTPHSGHYVCYVRKGGLQGSAVDALKGGGDWAEGAQWFLANDEEVRGATPEEVRSQQAYILLYEGFANAPLPTDRSNGVANMSPLPTPRPGRSGPDLSADAQNCRFGANPLSPDYLRQLHQLRIDRDQARDAETAAAVRGWGASPALTPAAVPAAPSARVRYFPRPFPGFSFFSIKASKRRQERNLQGLGQHLSQRQRGASAVGSAQGGAAGARTGVWEDGEIERTFFAEQHQGAGTGPSFQQQQQQQQQDCLMADGYEDSPAVRGLKRRRLSDSWCDEDLPLPTASAPITDAVCVSEAGTGTAAERGAQDSGRRCEDGGEGAAAQAETQRLGKRKNGEVSGAGPGHGEDGRLAGKKATSSWLAGLLPKPVRSLLGWR